MAVSCSWGEEGAMASAKVTFSHTGSSRADARPEGTEAVSTGTKLSSTRQLQAELFYRIFRGEDERLQELAMRCLLEGQD